jgi:hypothetical protein
VKENTTKLPYRINQVITEENLTLLTFLVNKNEQQDVNARWSANKLSAKCFINILLEVMKDAIEGKFIYNLILIFTYLWTANEDDMITNKEDMNKYCYKKQIYVAIEETIASDMLTRIMKEECESACEQKFSVVILFH